MDYEDDATRRIARTRLETTMQMLASEGGRDRLALMMRGLLSQKPSRCAIAKKFGILAARNAEERSALRELYVLGDGEEEWRTCDPRDLCEDPGTFYACAYWMRSQDLCEVLNETTVSAAAFRLFASPGVVWPHVLLTLAIRLENALVSVYTDKCGLFSSQPTPQDLAVLEGIVFFMAAGASLKLSLGRARRDFSRWSCLMLMHNAHGTTEAGATQLLEAMGRRVAGTLVPQHHVIAREYRIVFGSLSYAMSPPKAMRFALFKIVNSRRGDGPPGGCGALGWEQSDDVIQNYVATVCADVARRGDAGEPPLQCTSDADVDGLFATNV
jgi:hypothetical protein